MNREGNTYTIVYAAVMVIIVAVLLAFTAESLKSRQNQNAEIDKKTQLLRSIRISSNADNADNLYNQNITDSYLVNTNGERVDGDAFAVDQEFDKEMRKPMEERTLPVYEASVEGSKKYILPLYGSGLWGPIWGYVALDEDKSTIYGATFGHKGETPGLGAEIDTKWFQEEFYDKKISRDGKFTSVAVLKAGQTRTDMDYVDGISGGTITSQGVDEMLKHSLEQYKAFLGLQ
ncbi:MAG: NADH:ubiquinone reductase (Na(+)-transporting) subunit C [Candidatus Azobacteroides sp.]|nr:NADH:ubiquinone reductase (Na(+)-transporting) subunit C [Candidatus Azobacteroides sp.]